MDVPISKPEKFNALPKNFYPPFSDTSLQINIRSIMGVENGGRDYQRAPSAEYGSSIQQFLVRNPADISFRNSKNISIK